MITHVGRSHAPSAAAGSAPNPRVGRANRALAVKQIVRPRCGRRRNPPGERAIGITLSPAVCRRGSDLEVVAAIVRRADRRLRNATVERERIAEEQSEHLGRQLDLALSELGRLRAGIPRQANSLQEGNEGYSESKSADQSGRARNARSRVC